MLGEPLDAKKVMHGKAKACKTNKLRILIASWTIPENNMGGGLLLHRHFVLRSDFEIGIVTPNPAQTAPVFHRLISEPAWLERLKRTRFSRWFHDYTHLVYARQFNAQLLAAAREFQPDLIFNVAETWVSFHALKLARKLQIPFACYFMDWAHYATYCHKWALPLMDRSYRQLYRESDLAFCISDGMQEELGPHPNSHVLYPICNPPRETQKKLPKNKVFTFLFAGNLAYWYGQQVAEILKLIPIGDNFTLKVFGKYQDWPSDFEASQVDCGRFLGFRTHEELVPELEAADAFFLTMGFSPKNKIIERTSFKTKFLDYLSYKKPILIWGPEYCTAVRLASQYNSAFCVTKNSAHEAIKGMRQIVANLKLREEITQNACALQKNLFTDHQINIILKNQLLSICKN